MSEGWLLERVPRLTVLLVLLFVLGDAAMPQSDRPAPLSDRPGANAQNAFPFARATPTAEANAPALKNPGPRPGLSPESAGLQFQPEAIYGSGAFNPISVAVADVNGDGKLDLLVANECVTQPTCPNGEVGVLLGNGDGTFQPAASFDSGGYSAYAIAAGDLNGDGHPDLAVANYSASGHGEDGILGVLLGNGDGTFQPAVAYDSGGSIATSVTIADVNGDGKPDLVVSNECNAPCTTHGVVAVLLGNGDGTFKKAVKYPAGLGPDSVVVADVNGDGKPDAVVADFCINSKCASGAVDVLLGNGDGTFKKAVPYNSGGAYPNMVSIADLRGNGKLDLVVGNGCSTGTNCSPDGVVGVLLGNGDGTFQKAVTYDSGGPEAYSVAVADVNGDGIPDIVVGNGGNLGVLLGNGDGTFQPAVTLNLSFGANSVALADLTGNGLPDIVVSANQASNVGVLINGPATRTATATSLGSSLNPSAIGLPVTFTAQVATQGTGTPTGTIAFYDGATKIATSTLNSNEVATFTTSTLAVGTDNMTAVYSGDSNFAPSNSNTVSQVVQGGGGVVFSPNSLNFGTQVDGSVTGPYTAYMTNTGTKTVKISSIQIVPVSGSYGNYSQTNNCGTKLKAGASCAFNVTFTVYAIGEAVNAVSVTDNGPESPQMLDLYGDGVFQQDGKLDWQIHSATDNAIFPF
jgi:Bacterial Ig-like domain (group 3)/FG-GAP-like repeat